MIQLTEPVDGNNPNPLTADIDMHLHAAARPAAFVSSARRPPAHLATQNFRGPIANKFIDLRSFDASDQDIWSYRVAVTYSDSHFSTLRLELQERRRCHHKQTLQRGCVPRGISKSTLCFTVSIPKGT